MEFELSRLTSYDRSSMVAELQRVASLTPDGVPLTAHRFALHSKASPTTYRRHFGSWRAALESAGLGSRYSGRNVTTKSVEQAAKGVSDSDLILEMRRVARLLGIDTLTREQFDAQSTMSASTPARRFGSWHAALSAAGLSPAPLGRRYSDEDYFENLLAVWTHYGRQPKYREMNGPPSVISAGGYEKRFGGWTKALLAFLEFANTEGGSPQALGMNTSESPSRTVAAVLEPENTQLAQRKISLGLRYDVLRRDSFKCVLCGRSPALDPTCTLHVDHIHPFSKGGRTTEDNLRTLCSQCNIGKGSKLERSI